mmetsp:Transcript_8689/g.32735  ORF Transcript_8689/g.32735 Transcript_8689/m.32735 type:complete len:245 (-) Transcript_8689:489-1223(-)
MLLYTSSRRAFGQTLLVITCSRALSIPRASGGLDYHRLQSLSSHNPLLLAQSMWREALSGGRCALDLTCGKGADSLFIANELFRNVNSALLVCVDVQEKAVKKTYECLEGAGFEPGHNRIPDVPCRAAVFQGSHHELPAAVLSAIEGDPPSLIVYNLGYLPGTDKSVKTTADTTLQSVTASMDMIAPGGLISIMCYPGHPEGKEELEALRTFAAGVSAHDYCVQVHEQINREETPCLITMVRRR